MDSCFDLAGSHQHGVASNKVISWSTDHPLNTDGDDLRGNSNLNVLKLANVTCKACDKEQQEKFGISTVSLSRYGDCGQAQTV